MDRKSVPKQLYWLGSKLWETKPGSCHAGICNTPFTDSLTTSMLSKDKFEIIICFSSYFLSLFVDKSSCHHFAFCQLYISFSITKHRNTENRYSNISLLGLLRAANIFSYWASSREQIQENIGPPNVRRPEYKKPFSSRGE